MNNKYAKIFTFTLCILFIFSAISFADSYEEKLRAKSEADFADVKSTHKYTPNLFSLEKADLPLEDFESGVWPPAGWTEYHTGIDALDESTVQAYSPTRSAHFDDVSGVDSSWFVTPQILALDANSQISFYQYQGYASYYEYHAIWVSTGYADPDSGDYVEVVETGVGAGPWELVTVDLSAYAGQDVYVAFVYSGSYADDWWLDDVSVGPPAAVPGFYLTKLVIDGGNPGGLNTDLDYTSTGWTEIVGPSNTGNFWSSGQAIPFGFEFFGNAVTHFKVSQNGLVTFDTSTAILPDQNENLPSANLPDSTIACFWDTVTNAPPTGSNDRIYTKVFGTAPNQQLWIRYHSFEYGSPNISYAYFALVLEESSNSIYMVDMNYHSTSTGMVTSTVGVQLNMNTAVQYGSNDIIFGSGGSGYADNDYYEFYIPFADDISLTEVFTSSSTTFPGYPISISAVINNLGTNDQTGFDVSYDVDDGSSSTYNYAGTLSSGATDTVAFPTQWTAADTGTFTITAYSQLVGDQNTSNDTSATTVISSIEVAPFFEDFETGITGTPGTLPAGWTNETDDDQDWYVDAGGTGSPGTGPAVDHTLGTAAGIYIYTEASSGRNDKWQHVTSPWIDVSGLTAPALSFWYHMAGGAMGDLHVDVYDGTTWYLDIQDPLSGPHQGDPTDPWLLRTADLSGYGNTVKVRFRGLTGGGWASDMAVDDVNIDEASLIPYDIIAHGIETPVLSLVPLSQSSILSATNFATTFSNQAVANTGDVTLEVYDTTGAVIHTDGDIGFTIPAFGSSSFSYGYDASGVDSGTVYNAAIFATNFTDTVPVNDTSWAYSMTFGDQMGYDQGNWDVNLAWLSPGTRTRFATRFDLLDDDVLISVTLGLGSGGATDSFSIDLFSSVGDTPSVMLSRIFRGTFADAGGPSATVTFTAPDIPLTAGDYWIVFDLDAVTGYPIGADANAIGSGNVPMHFAMAYDAGWIFLENTSFGGYTPILRIGLSGAIPYLTIAEARIDNDGDFVPDRLGQVVTVTGIVTTPNFSSSSTDYFIQDTTAGIDLFAFSFNKKAAFNLGDEVMVTGEIDQYRGKTEIIPTDSTGVIVVSTGNLLPDPQVITIAQVGEDYEGELIRLNGVWLVDPGQWPAAGSNANLDLTDGVDTVTMRIDKEMDVDDNPAITGVFDLIAVVGQYTFSTPPNDGYQVFPRFYTDFIIPDPSIIFADDFEAYTAGTQLTVQNSVDWQTWSGTPGTGEDPFVSSTYSNSGVNSVNIITNNDVVKVMPNYTTGAYKISFDLYVPTGTVAYFNTLQEFTPTTTWGMQVYFRAGGVGEMDADGALSASFTYAYDTWLHNEVVVNLEKDTAEYYIDGVRIHGWQWSEGPFGGNNLNQLGGNNFFGGGPTGTFDYYIDDYELREVSPAIFADDFEAYTAGTQLVVQNPVGWTTWSGTPGTGEDPYVSNAYAQSGVNSVVIATGNDLIKLLGSQTSGVWSTSWNMYIPDGKVGYFNTMAGFTPNPFSWAMWVDFNVGAGAGGAVLDGVPGSPVAFSYAYDTWQHVELVVDLDQDLAELHFDGTLIHQWQWTDGGTTPLRLDATDFYGGSPDDEMYVDDYVFDTADPITPPVGIDDKTDALPLTFDLGQNYPNPFNPTTTIKYQLPKKADVKIVIYNMLGQVVRTVVDKSVDAGYQEVVWDGLNETGSRVATGVYVYRMEADKFVKANKMIMMK